MDMNSEDIMLWCDGTWCYRNELDELLLFMSDDFSTLEYGSEEWKELYTNEKVFNEANHGNGLR